MRELLITLITALCPSCVTYQPTCHAEYIYSCKKEKCQVQYKEWDENGQLVVEHNYTKAKPKDNLHLGLRAHSFICVK